MVHRIECANMKKQTALLFSILSLACFAEEELANQEIATDQVVVSDSIAMQKIAKAFQIRSAGERVADLEDQMKEVYTDTVRGDFGARAASARPQVVNNYRVYTKVDALFWKQYEGGTDYAYTDQVGTSSSVIFGTNKHLSFDWSYGFRVETGYRVPHDSWDFLGKFTWLHSHAHSSVGAPSLGTIQPLYPAYESHTSSQASSEWKTHLSVLDVELNKNYFLSSDFAVKPTIGLRNAWIDQKLHATYVDYPASGGSTKIFGRNDFWGIGPLTKMDLTYYFDSSWHMFSSIGGAILFSDIHVHSKESQGSTDVIDLNGNVRRIAPVLEGAVGFAWEMLFNDCQNHIAVRLSYEAQYWWRQNQLLHFGPRTQGGAPYMRRVSEDLGFNGVTVDLLIDF
jgi:hypothetical protein